MERRVSEMWEIGVLGRDIKRRENIFSCLLNPIYYPGSFSEGQVQQVNPYLLNVRVWHQVTCEHLVRLAC